MHLDEDHNPNYRKGLGLLILIALILGSIPTAIKDVITTVSPSVQMTICCAIASIVMTPFVRTLNWPVIRDGMSLGVLAFAIYATEAIGLVSISANRTSFIFGLTVVFVTLYEVMMGKRVSLLVLGASSLAFLGIGLMSWDTGEPWMGSLWMVGCALLTALYILVLDTIAANHSPLSLATTETWTATLLGCLWAMPNVFSEIEAIRSHLGPLLYLGVVATALITWLYVLVQQWVPAYEVALFHTLAPIFGSILAYALLGETLGLRSLSGAVFVLSGMVLVLRDSDPEPIHPDHES